jgi:diaminopimelate epimerase
MSGCGNDFIIIDNRKEVVDAQDLPIFVSKVCERKMSVGADGLILVEKSDKYDFCWRFFNSDGSIPEMCGNGARCAARFAYVNSIAKSDMKFETLAGIVSASIKDQRVKVEMPDTVVQLEAGYEIQLKTGKIVAWSLNTGVPHVVIQVDNVNNVDVFRLGREIRNHKEFAPDGTNVNFISRLQDHTNMMRTYERGVENETLACGTGAIASALVIAYTGDLNSPVTIQTRSKNNLCIYFRKQDNRFSDIYLEGDARIIYRAELTQEAWKY